MDFQTKAERREDPRFETAIHIRFNLNPDYHFLQGIRRLGVEGTIRNLSRRGVGIDSEMDLLDVCQIFSEEMKEDSPFELEVVLWSSRGTRLLIKGSVSWYQLSELDGDIRHFQAGLHLKDGESIDATRSMIESASKTAMA